MLTVASLIGSFLRVWHLVSVVAAVAELASGHTLSYSPLRELAADGIRDRRKYPLTYQNLAAESSRSAVTVTGRDAIPIGI
jgi:hypothetical protein